MGRHSRPRPARGLLALFALVAIVVAGCPELGTFTSSQRTPFTVTLTMDRPAAIRDFAITMDRRATAPYAPSITSSLYLANIDPRVRVALLDDSGTIAQYLTYGYVGSGPGTVAELARSSDCPATDPCVATARILFELPDPAPGEALTVSGEIVSTASYPSMQTPSHTLGTVSRLASGVEMAAPEIRSALVRGDTVTLDAAHPIALQKIRLHLDPGKDLDPHLAVSGAEISLDPESLASGNIGLSAYPAGLAARAVRATSCPPVRCCRRLVRSRAVRPPPYATWITSCGLAWMGPATGSQRVSWSLEPFIAGYGAAGLADDVKVTGTPTPAQTVRDDAPFFSRTYEGRLELTSGTRDGRAQELRLSGLRAEAGKDVAERPGIAMLTYKAVGRDGPVKSTTPGSAPCRTFRQTPTPRGRTSISVSKNSGPTVSSIPLPSSSSPIASPTPTAKSFTCSRCSRRRAGRACRSRSNGRSRSGPRRSTRPRSGLMPTSPSPRASATSRPVGPLRPFGIAWIRAPSSAWVPVVCAASSSCSAQAMTSSIVMTAVRSASSRTSYASRMVTSASK